jgi:hypothetical protein
MVSFRRWISSGSEHLDGLRRPVEVRVHGQRPLEVVERLRRLVELQ